MNTTPTKGFLPAVLTLLSGTTIAMGLAYAARPILTRLFTPDDFGLLGFFMALVAVLTTVSAGRYEDAVLLPEQDRDAAGLLILCAGLTFATSLGAGLLVLWRDAIAGFFHKPEIAPYLVYVPIAVFAAGLMRWSSAWLNREKRFKLLAGGKITHNAVEVPIQLGTGASYLGAEGLIIGRVAGQVAAALVYTTGILKWHRALIRSAYQGALIRRVAYRYRDFPRFAMPSAFLNTASVQLPALMLFFFFDEAVVGYYAQSYGLLAVPIALVGGSVAQVFFVHATEAHRAGTLRSLTELVFRRLTLLGLFPILALVVAGPDVLEFVLGENWREAGVYVQWLGLWLFFVFVSSPLSHLFDVLERQRANLAFNVLVFTTRAGALLIGGWLHNPLLAIALFGASGAGIWLFHTFWMLKLGEVPIGAGLRILLRYSLYAAIPLWVLWMVKASGVGAGWVTLTAVGCTLGYFGVVWVIDRIMEHG